MERAAHVSLMAAVVVLLTAVLFTPFAHAEPQPSDAAARAELERIKTLCMKKWTDEDGTKWTMVEYCIDSNYKSYMNVRNISK